MMTRKIVIVAATVLLGACALKGPLEPLAGQTPPPTPTGAEATPSADDLLELNPQAAPERSVELR
ncbi:MAG: hypothetical protein WAT93_04135, partial [Pontixanthobacter sp.]